MKTNEVNKEISYETLLVTFGEGIGRLNTMFDDPQVWGVATLKQWIDGYETTRVRGCQHREGGFARSAFLGGEGHEFRFLFHCSMRF